MAEKFTLTRMMTTTPIYKTADGRLTFGSLEQVYELELAEEDDYKWDGGESDAEVFDHLREGEIIELAEGFYALDADLDLQKITID